MNKRKLFTAFLCILLIVSLCACSQTGLPAATPGAAAPKETQSAATQAPSQQTGAEAAAASASISDTPTETAEPASSSQIAPSETKAPGEVWYSSDGSWYVELPDSWAGHYGVKDNGGSVIFYDTANADAGYGGTLFTIKTYAEDETYDYLPDYQLLAEHNGLSYVALFPTDVQCNSDDQTLLDLHTAMMDGLSDWVPTCLHFTA